MTTKERPIFLKFRVTDSESKAFAKRANKLGVTVSKLIRDSALYGAVEVSLTKSEVGYEFRRLGALLKHLYPSGDNSWTPEEKKEWWSMIQELRQKADRLEALASGGKGQPVQEGGD